QKITVLLADDHTVVRQGLRSLLEAEEDMSVVGEAENGRQAVQMARRLQPAVVAMDIAMPSLNGLEATRQISKESHKSKVLILSSYSDDEYVQQLTDAGASGYLVKQTAAQDLVAAIREAKKGNAFFSPAISKRLLEHYRASLGKPPGEKESSKQPRALGPIDRRSDTCAAFSSRRCSKSASGFGWPLRPSRKSSRPRPQSARSSRTNKGLTDRLWR